MILLIIFGIFILLVIYSYWSSNKDKHYFESRGISYTGNRALSILINMCKGIGFMEGLHLQYKKIRADGHKLVGTNAFNLLTLTIVDPELLRSVFVKDFDHFAERRQFSKTKTDMMFAKMLISLQGEQWKALRSKLSPTFTTGKIKRLFPCFDESGKKLVTFLEKELNATNGTELDLMEGYSKFTMDVIASAVCGIDSQAFDQKEPSRFEQMGMKMQFQFGAKVLMKVIIMMASTKLSTLLGLSLFDKEVEDFFSGTIKSSIRHRQEHDQKPNDFLQLMLEAREDKLKIDEGDLDNFEKDAIIKEQTADSTSGAELLDDDGIVANAVLFMLAGYDTVQSLLLFCAYSLATNQEVQDKLRTEIDAVFEEDGEKLSYESLNNMNYLDMVINETLRYYPPAGATDRGCTKDYKVPGTDFVLKKGQGILIPIYGLHHDEEYYPEPEKFNPERFSKENKGKIKPYTFLPFGQGMRFALAEVKVAIAHLVHNFNIEPSAKTMIPMMFSKATSLKPEGGMYLGLRKIRH